MRRATVAAFAAFALLSGKAAAQSPTQLPTGREAFNVVLPPSCHVVRSGGAEDFETYAIKCAQRALVGIYTGNAPRPIAGARILATRYAWPSVVQVWVLDGKSANRQEAERLAKTVQVSDSE